MVSSDGEGLRDGAERRVRWGLDREGTQEEYDAFLEGERERLDKDPELVRFMERVKGFDEGVKADLQTQNEDPRSEGGGVSGAKGRARSLYLSDATWDALQSMAVEAGFERGSGGNVSAFVDAWVWNKLKR